MAIVSMADAVFNGIASSAEYNKLIDNIEDLDARLGAVVAASTAHARLTALESLTTNTSGTVGIGNQRLSDRLGAGITTAATADARFGSGVGTGANVTTGSATSQLTDLRSRVAVVESAGSGVAFTERTGTSTSIGTGYTAVPFATSVVSGGGVTVLGGAVANTRFQLDPGVWDITAYLNFLSSANLAAALYVESSDGASPASNSTRVLSFTTGAGNSGLAISNLAGTLYVPTATTAIVRVSAAISTATTLATGVNAPRITFQRLST